MGTLIPLSIVVIVTSIAIPLLLRSCNDGWTTFKSANDAKKYFNSHKKVHDDTHDWSSQPIDYAEMCNYFWNRDNYGAQNMINGELAELRIFFDDIGNDALLKTISLKCSNDGFYLKLDAVTDVNEFTTEQFSMNWKSNNGQINFAAIVNNNLQYDYLIKVSGVCVNEDYEYCWSIDFLSSMGYSRMEWQIWSEEYPNITVPHRNNILFSRNLFNIQRR